MNAARETVQAHGYNALSFCDLAAEIGIKNASVHYHVPTKGDLGVELARRYTTDGSAYLSDLMADDKDQRSCIKNIRISFAGRWWTTTVYVCAAS